MPVRPDTSKFKVLIFDLFHTLSSMHHSDVPGLYSHEVIGITYEEWLEALFSDSERRARGIIKEPNAIIRDITDKLEMNISDETIEKLARIRYERFDLALKNILPHTVETLKELKKRGKTLILLSNADVCEIRGWKDSPASLYFDHSIFSCHVGLVKPEPEIYEHAVKLSGASKDECLFIGDGGSDELKGAKDFGMQPASLRNL